MILLAFVLPIFIALLAAWAWSISWVIRDTRRRGQSGAALPIVLIFGPLGVLAWLAMRPNQETVNRPRADYKNPDDTFLAASELDADGDWDQAVALYQYGAERWPEHRAYAEKSIEQIRKKQA